MAVIEPATCLPPCHRLQLCLCWRRMSDKSSPLCMSTCSFPCTDSCSTYPLMFYKPQELGRTHIWYWFIHCAVWLMQGVEEEKVKWNAAVFSTSLLSDGQRRLHQDTFTLHVVHVLSFWFVNKGCKTILFLLLVWSHDFQFCEQLNSYFCVYFLTLPFAMEVTSCGRYKNQPICVV